MNGLIFPGQGSQTVGMGMELYKKLHSAKILLDQAEDILNFDIKRIMSEGPQEILTDTRIAQPAIYICSAMYLEKIRSDDIDYDCVAGHSLGEYDALLAAEVFDFEEGLRLVAKRGEYMGQMNGKGTMAAVIGMSEEELQPYMADGAVMANLNSKSQIVISGTYDAIEKTEENLRGIEGIRFKRLQVSAAFHSPQMKEAAEKMEPLINAAEFKIPKCNVISNVTGKQTKSPEIIKSNLLAQITGQVRWYDTIMTMKEIGVKTIYETGYGDVLKKLNKTITFRPKCIGV